MQSSVEMNTKDSIVLASHLLIQTLRLASLFTLLNFFTVPVASTIPLQWELTEPEPNPTKWP